MNKRLLFGISVLMCALIMLLCGCQAKSNNSSTNEPEEVETEQAEEETVSTEEESVEVSEDDIKLKELGVFKQEYSNATNRGFAYIVENTSDTDVQLNAVFVFKDAKGKPVGSADSNTCYIKAGGKSLLYAYDEMSEFKDVEPELDVSSSEYKVLSDKLKTESTLTKEEVIVSMTNNSDKDCEYAEAYCAFFNGDKLIDCSTAYCTDDDSVLKAGKTRTGNADWVNDTQVNKVKVFPNGIELEE